jgi:hypothetical protein
VNPFTKDSGQGATVVATEVANKINLLTYVYTTMVPISWFCRVETQRDTWRYCRHVTTWRGAMLCLSNNWSQIVPISWHYYAQLLQCRGWENSIMNIFSIGNHC